MSDTAFTLSVVFFLGAGSVFGMIYNFLMGEDLLRAPHNVLLCITGALAGLLLARALPVLPNYRTLVDFSFAIQFANYFMIGSWIHSKRKTRVERNRISDSRAHQRPAA